MLIVLAFALGAVIVSAVVVLGLRLVQRRWTTEVTESFVVHSSAPAVENRIAAIVARRRGWRMPRTQHAAGSVLTIKCRTTPSTWTRTIQCRVVDEGRSACMVTLSCATPQFYDWGECRRTVSRLRTDITELAASTTP
jgi:hypothetical protein